MSQITPKGLSSFNEPELAFSIRQGLMIGCPLVAALIIITILIICCCCNVHPQREKKSSDKPRDVKKNTEADPNLAQNQTKMPVEVGGGKKQDLKGEAANDQREKRVRFPYYSNGDCAKTSSSKTTTSLPIHAPEVTLPSYAKVRGEGASDFYLNATSQ
ncbi:unnamed protein product [Rodentolepis nana]|uniref:Uncharacterized protein n=1 Tax=Rodentolepis nana TaxID=102285 RepID=A0A0R3TEN1_RODNA|nr:unnamed protein product [Rodentolepis nana]